MVDFISTDSVSAVTQAWVMALANTNVALSDAFLQKGRAPVHSAVSNNSIKSMRLFPLLDDYGALEEAVADPLKQLMTDEVPDLDALTEEVDTASQTVLAPPTESPSAETPRTS